MKFNLEDITKMSALIIVSTFILLIFSILGSRQFDADFFAAFGAILSAMIAAAGIPILLQNIKKQDESIEELKVSREQERLNKEFNMLCQSIDIGLSLLDDEDFGLGASRILLYSRQNKSNRELNVLSINALGVEQLNSVSICFISLINWTLENIDKKIYFEMLFVRYLPIIDAVLSFIPEDLKGMNFEYAYEYFKRDLPEKDFDILFSNLLKLEYLVFRVHRNNGAIDDPVRL